MYNFNPMTNGSNDAVFLELCVNGMGIIFTRSFKMQLRMFVYRTNWQAMQPVILQGSDIHMHMHIATYFLLTDLL